MSQEELVSLFCCCFTTMHCDHAKAPGALADCGGEGGT
jgi:hypothetical protein